MTAQDLMAVARAEQDWRDGLSADETLSRLDPVNTRPTGMSLTDS